MPYIQNKELHQLILAGVKMSNLCFNLGQQRRTRHQIMMMESQEDWDAKLKQLRDGLKARADRRRGGK